MWLGVSSPCLLLAAQQSNTATAPTPFRILVLGDSLSAEYGLPRGSGWVTLLEKQLQQRGIPASLVNASVSGETTSGGRSRLSGLLQQHRPTHLILELGGNDALRGAPLTMARENLKAMSQEAQKAGAKVLLLGMRVPPNYGRRYSDDFAKIFFEVAESEKISLVPFFLEGIADDPKVAAQMFQPDQIHPNEKAQPQMQANVWAVFKNMFEGY